MNPSHFYRHVIVPTLKRADLYSEAAAKLLLGTAMTESGLTWLVQHNDGPARGVYQMEPATHDDIWSNYLAYRPQLAQSIEAFMSGEPEHDQLVTNLAYATVMARVHYLRVPEALPHPDNMGSLGAYWKDHYNTHLGAGQADHFTDKVGPVLQAMAATGT